jgi:hypothetical protein
MMQGFDSLEKGPSVMTSWKSSITLLPDPLRTWTLAGSAILCACSAAPTASRADGGEEATAQVDAAGGNDAIVSDVTVGDAGAKTDGAGEERGDGDAQVLPLGTSTSSPLASCPADAYPGSACTSVTVSCGGIASDTATVAVVEPTGTAVGTVLFVAGGGGTKFFSIPENSALLAAHLRLVGIEWTTDWPSAKPASALNAACRAATLSQWIYENVHGGAEAAKTAGFCGMGMSGGGAFFTYSMAHYGAKSIFDYLQILSGPSVSRLDYGCDPSLYDGGPRYLCPALPNPPFAFTPPTTSQINGMEGTTTCGADAAAPSDIAKWTADSIVSPGADYEYPQTDMSFWFCAGTDLNESSGLGSFLVEKLRPMGKTPAVNCYTDCMGENVLGDPSALSASEAAMIAGCVPHHS